jgi:hypothetical protein
MISKMAQAFTSTKYFRVCLMVTLIIFPIDIVDNGSMTVTGTMLSKGNHSQMAQRFSYF